MSALRGQLYDIEQRRRDREFRLDRARRYVERERRRTRGRKPRREIFATLRSILGDGDCDAPYARARELRRSRER
jgi:hypothetical protein